MNTLPGTPLHTAKVSPYLLAALCENCIVKMEWGLRSRSASPARDENAASVTSNIAAEVSVMMNWNEVSQMWRQMSNSSNVTSGCNESPVSFNQLHNMLAACKAAMQAENTKLATNLESRLNKLSKNFSF